MGRPVANLTLTEDERSELRGWARRPTTAQAHALRARIILACAEGASNGDVADDLGVTRQTVGKRRQRFVEKRLDGLLDAPRSGTPRTITDEEVERVIATALEQTPKNATHWSTRSMAKATGLTTMADANSGLPEQRITADAAVCGGRPCIRGMRIRVGDVNLPISGGHERSIGLDLSSGGSTDAQGHEEAELHA